MLCVIVLLFGLINIAIAQENNNESNDNQNDNNSSSNSDEENTENENDNQNDEENTGDVNDSGGDENDNNLNFLSEDNNNIIFHKHEISLNLFGKLIGNSNKIFFKMGFGLDYFGYFHNKYKETILRLGIGPSLGLWWANTEWFPIFYVPLKVGLSIELIFPNRVWGLFATINFGFDLNFFVDRIFSFIFSSDIGAKFLFNKHIGLKISFAYEFYGHIVEPHNLTLNAGFIFLI